MFIEIEVLGILAFVILLLISALVLGLRKSSGETVELKKENTELQKLAMTDRLTELHNRRFFDEQLAHEEALARRTKESLSVCLIDIDKFKLVNDTHGHLSGDEVLRQIAKVCTKVCRDQDWVVRFGGEEFAFILPNTNAKGASVLMERLKDEVLKYPFWIPSGDKTIRITISIGIAETVYENGSEKAGNDIVGRADDKLYQAKKTRNTIVAEGM